MQTLHGRPRSPPTDGAKTPVHPLVCIDYSHQDLDILCLTSYPGGAEAIKERLCQENNHFYTVRARNRHNHWAVLWWRTCSDEPGFERFKIDILTPGVLEFPHIPPNYVTQIRKFPCAPLHLLLLHKLKGWDDRRFSHLPHVRAKIDGDVQDIEALLVVASERKPTPNIARGKPYITDSFRAASYIRVSKFVRKHPNFAHFFACLGLPNPADKLHGGGDYLSRLSRV